MSEPIEYQISELLLGTGMTDTLAESLAEEVMRLLAEQPTMSVYGAHETVDGFRAMRTVLVDPGTYALVKLG